MENYYHHVATLPADLRTIHEFCWDSTGRPSYNKSYNIAMGRLLMLCDDWDMFVVKYQQLFFNKDVTESATRVEMELVWHVFITGMRTLAEKLNQKPITLL